MTHNVRVFETDSGEVYIDINDMVIHLLLEADSSDSEDKRNALKALANKLSDIRDKAHKVSSKKVHTQKI